MQIGRTLGWWLFVPALAALAVAAVCGGRGRQTAIGWSRRLFGLALFARLALPAAGWIDSWVAARFLEANYQEAAAVVTATREPGHLLHDLHNCPAAGNALAALAADRGVFCRSRWLVTAVATVHEAEISPKNDGFWLFQHGPAEDACPRGDSVKSGNQVLASRFSQRNLSNLTGGRAFRSS